MDSDDGMLVPVNDVKTREEKAYRAYQMRLAGTSHAEIAQKLGYPNPRRVSTEIKLLVDKAVEAVSEERKSEVVELELDRLDALQNAVWGMAIGGDLKAVDSVLKIMTHRAKLLSLGSDTNNTAASTVIISSEDYVNTLKDLSK